MSEEQTLEAELKVEEEVMPCMKAINDRLQQVMHRYIDTVFKDKGLRCKVWIPTRNSFL